MRKNDRKFTLDYERLKEICVRAYRAFEEEKGVFRRKRGFLPQWVIPQEFEYDPQREETRNVEAVGNYLFVLATMEKRAQSKENIKNGLKTWANPDTRWIFNPLEVVARKPEEVREVVNKGLRYRIHDFAGMLMYNNEKLVAEYNGFARNIIDGQLVEEARRRLMKFKGIGTGISNLYITYCADRKLATVLDLDQAMLKVDIHKTKIPVNTEAVIPQNGRIRRDNLTPILEENYRQICKKEGFSAKDLDAALWIVGSEICAQKDFGKCSSFCPLNDLCASLVTEDVLKGEIVARDENGKRVEMKHNRRVQTKLDL